MPPIGTLNTQASPIAGSSLFLYFLSLYIYQVHDHKFISPNHKRLSSASIKEDTFHSVIQPIGLNQKLTFVGILALLIYFKDSITVHCASTLRANPVASCSQTK